MGRKSRRWGICVSGWPVHFAETNTTLQNNYTPVKNFEKFKNTSPRKRKTGRKLKCMLLSKRSQSEKAIYCTLPLSCSVMSHSLRPHGLQPTRLLSSRDLPGKNTGVGCHFLLQGIFLTQRRNLCLLHSSTLAGRFFTTSATWEGHMYCMLPNI